VLTLLFLFFSAFLLFDNSQGSAMLTYIRNHQQADGGWGLHIEGPSTLFPTTLNYIAARLLGVKPDDKLCVAARAFMHAHGGAPYMPQWGKFWLCALNVYSWEGVNPMSPELWLLPMWFPFHPAKMWCHSRMCYLPMSFIYGARCTAKESPIIRALREEIFTPENPYSTCNWDKYRNTCASIDLYAPHHPIMDIALWLLSRYERYTPDFIRKNWLLKKALDFTLRYCEAEDLQTNYCDIGPVNKVSI
jgi:cycloartenol synthase